MPASASRTKARCIFKDLLFGLLAGGWSGLYGYFHHRIGPAALKTAPAIARPIVGYDAQYVFSRLAERRGSGGFSEDLGIAGRLELHLFDWRLVLGEGHRAGTAILTPGDL